MRCSLCGFLIIKQQTTLHHAVRCTVICNAVRLSHFTGDFGVVFAVWWIPLISTSHLTIFLSHSIVPFFFSSHLMVSSSYEAVPTSHLTVLLSYLVVFLFFFSHIWWFHPYIVQFQHHIWQFLCHIRWFSFFFPYIWQFHPPIVQFQHHMWQFFSHIRWFPYFFLTFDGSILILCNSNITYDSTFVIFDGSFFFSSHLTIPYSHCAIPTSHVTVLLSHLVVHYFFFSHIWWLGNSMVPLLFFFGYSTY